MIAISKIVKVDGEDVNITCEGVSAREALELCDAAAEELGAAPPSEAPAGSKKRGRRTKAEMDAARAAAASAGAPAGPDPTLPGIMPAPAQVFAPPMTGAQAEAVLSTAQFTDAPPLPQGPKTVEFAPPPFEVPGPPPIDPRDELADRIIATINATTGLAPEWSSYIDANYAKACAGRDVREILEALRDEGYIECSDKALERCAVMAAA